MPSIVRRLLLDLLRLRGFRQLPPHLQKGHNRGRLRLSVGHREVSRIRGWPGSALEVRIILR